MSSKRGRVALSLAAALAATACTPVPEIWLFNRSDVVLVVLPEGRAECRLLPGLRCVFDLPHSNRIVLRGGAQEAEYMIPGRLRYDNSPEYVELAARRTIKMQIEPDGTISILPAAAQQVGPALDPQPAGFPLRPVARRTPSTAP